MTATHSAVLRRFATSALIAVPTTIALLFLMTRLILPGERDQIVTRMIQDIEFERAVVPHPPAEIQVFDLPTAADVELPPTMVASTPAQIELPQIKAGISDETPNESVPARVIDWWAEARKLTQESDEEAFKRWMLEQGYVQYVSVMQGPLPITNSVQGTIDSTQEEKTGYLNSFGDLEFKISENCVMQTQVSARLDISDFAQKLPMRVTCKPARKIEYSFDRYGRD